MVDQKKLYLNYPQLESAIRQMWPKLKKPIIVEGIKLVLLDITIEPVVSSLRSSPFRLFFTFENLDRIRQIETLKVLKERLLDLEAYHAIRPYIYSINVVDPRYWQDRALAEEED